MLDKVEAPEFKLYPSTERDNKAPRDDISRRDLLPNRWKKYIEIFYSRNLNNYLLQSKK